MKKSKQKNIVSEISGRTGIGEKDIERILTEFASVLRDFAGIRQTAYVPGMGQVTLHTGEPSGKYEHKGSKRNPEPVNRLVVNDLDPAPAGTNPGRSRQYIIDRINSENNSKEILMRFMKLSELPNSIIARKIFEITPKTLLSYRNSERDMPVRMKEQIMKLEQLYEKGIDLFQNTRAFNVWLRYPSHGLGGIKPIDLLNSVTGSELVYEELVRIEYGATA